MLYLENDSFEKQIELVEYFSSIGNHDVMFWLFPASKCRKLCDLRLSPKDLVEGNPVTTYGDGSIGKRTRRTTLDVNLLQKIRECKKDIKENCDSIVIYEKGKKDWVACTIEHENMCLQKICSDTNMNSAKAAD